MPNYCNSSSSNPAIVCEYRLCSNRAGGNNNWATIYSFKDTEGLETWFTQTYGDTRVRDFVIRLRDVNTDHIYMQYANHPNYVFGDGSTFTNLEWSSLPRYSTATETGEKIHMIRVGIRRINNKLHLLVNAKEFHDELDKIGVAHDGARYLDRPASSATVATSNFVMSPEVLLRRDYKDVEFTEMVPENGTMVKTTRKVPVTASFDLSGLWTSPPGMPQLKKLCESAHDVARKILEHYQPIDISVEIHKKIVKQ